MREGLISFGVMVTRNFAAAIYPGFAALLFTSLTAIAFGAESIPSPVSTAQDRETYAQKFVNQKLHTWQERLNLKGWKVRAKLVRPDQLEPRTLGNIHWDLDTKEATIGVLSTYDYKLPYSEVLGDMELTLVHELVHLQLASLPRSDASQRDEEQAVNELSNALLKLSKE